LHGDRGGQPLPLDRQGLVLSVDVPHVRSPPEELPLKRRVAYLLRQARERIWIREGWNFVAEAPGMGVAAGERRRCPAAFDPGSRLDVLGRAPQGAVDRHRLSERHGPSLLAGRGLATEGAAVRTNDAHHI